MRPFVYSTFIGAIALTASPVHAQETDGAIQIGLATSVFSYTSASLAIEQLGQRTEVDSSGTTWGIHSSVAVEAGYGLSDTLVIGGVLQFGGESESSRLSQPGAQRVEATEFNVFLGPKLDFMFSPGAKVRPFIGAIAGIAMLSGEDADNVERSLIGFQMQGRVGLRWFPSPGFSIDPAVAGSWNTASGDIRGAGGSADISASGFSIGLVIGISGWAR